MNYCKFSFENFFLFHLEIVTFEAMIKKQV
jgi:hypothetical protein